MDPDGLEDAEPGEAPSDHIDALHETSAAATVPMCGDAYVVSVARELVDDEAEEEHLQVSSNDSAFPSA